MARRKASNAFTLEAPSGAALAYTKIKDASVKHLVGLKKLRVLDLESTEVTDRCLEDVARLENLEELNLYFNQINDDGLKHLARLKNLHTLDIANTAITDAAVKHLVGLKNLRYLEIDGITPEAMKRLTKALPKVRINTKPRRRLHEFAGRVPTGRNHAALQRSHHLHGIQQFPVDTRSPVSLH